MERALQTAITTFVAGLGLLIPSGMGLLLTNVPTILCPLPALTILPAFLLSSPQLEKGAIVVPTLLFFAWNPRLFRGEARVPKRSYALLVVATVLSLLYFVAGWEWGLQYQGTRFTSAVCIINVAWVAFLHLAFAYSWKRTTSFKYSLILHWMLFAWLAWYAFPYLGELP